MTWRIATLVLGLVLLVAISGCGGSPARLNKAQANDVAEQLDKYASRQTAINRQTNSCRRGKLTCIARTMDSSAQNAETIAAYLDRTSGLVSGACHDDLLGASAVFRQGGTLMKKASRAARKRNAELMKKYAEEIIKISDKGIQDAFAKVDKSCSP